MQIPLMLMNLSHTLSLPTTAESQAAADGNRLMSWMQSHWADLIVWLEVPRNHSTLIAWVVTFIVTYLILSYVGFTPQGIAAGSLAAAFQAWAYGGFTPAGGVFATLTSITMLGFVQPMFLAVAVTVASGVAGLVYIAWGPT